MKYKKGTFVVIPNKNYLKGNELVRNKRNP